MKIRIRQLRIKKHIEGHKPGDIVKIECDLSGMPLSRNWRRRLLDAKTDGCCEWAPELKLKVKPKRTNSDIKLGGDE
jgi:hypothetical protein